MSRPDSNPKSAFGMAKPGVSGIPPLALLHLGRAMEDGTAKYGLTNWRENSVSAGVYYNAAFRHLASWWDGEQEAQDSGVHHLGHVMACCAILLDAEAGGQLIDDRPAVPGKFSEMVKNLTRETGVELDVEVPESNVHDETVEASSGPEDPHGLCEDEGCPHHGIPHICLRLTPEAEEIIRQHHCGTPGLATFELERVACAAPIPGRQLYQRPPVQAGGPLDPSSPKTAEIVAVVDEFTRGCTDDDKRIPYVLGWLDRNGYRSVGQIGSIRDQAALYDFIEAYAPGIG